MSDCQSRPLGGRQRKANLDISQFFSRKRCTSFVEASEATTSVLGADTSHALRSPESLGPAAVRPHPRATTSTPGGSAESKLSAPLDRMRHRLGIPINNLVPVCAGTNRTNIKVAALEQ